MLEQPKKPERSAQPKQAITLNVHLAPGNSSTQFLLANYTAVSVAQGIAHVDFGFIEPALFGALWRAIQHNKPIPKGVRGTRAAGIAMPLDALVRLQQQLQQTLMNLRRQAVPPKGEPKEQTGYGDVSRPCQPQTAERIVANAACAGRVRLKRGTAASCEVSWQSHLGDLGKIRGR